MTESVKKVSKIIDVSTVKVIRSKGPRVKDPIRFPKVIVPLEKGMSDDYLRMMDMMVRTIQVEMLRQTTGGKNK